MMYNSCETEAIEKTYRVSKEFNVIGYERNNVKDKGAKNFKDPLQIVHL